MLCCVPPRPPAGVIQARLRERLGVPDLPGNALMQNPSIKQLAQQILEAKARRAARRRVPKPIMDRAMSTVSGLLVASGGCCKGVRRAMVVGDGLWVKRL